jgi:hypothetical protein
MDDWVLWFHLLCPFVVSLGEQQQQQQQQQ